MLIQTTDPTTEFTYDVSMALIYSLGEIGDFVTTVIFLTDFLIIQNGLQTDVGQGKL
jgi:hypothetical protein